jgi:hypothetical protein
MNVLHVCPLLRHFFFFFFFSFSFSFFSTSSSSFFFSFSLSPLFSPSCRDRVLLCSPGWLIMWDPPASPS